MLDALFVLASEVSLQQNQKNEKKIIHMLTEQKIAKCGEKSHLCRERAAETYGSRVKLKQGFCIDTVADSVPEARQKALQAPGSFLTSAQLKTLSNAVW